MWYMRLVETGHVPDMLICGVLRLSLYWTLRRRYALSLETRSAEKRAMIKKYKRSPIAIHTSDPNHQHYEVPTEFFQLVLGKWLKYSSCYWPANVSNLDEAEEAMLDLTCQTRPTGEWHDGARFRLWLGIA